MPRVTCCSLLVAALLSMGYCDQPFRVEADFSTPMFLRGRPVWVTPVSRRQLLKATKNGSKKRADPPTDVALVLA
jgi:hypothetical protein